MAIFSNPCYMACGMPLKRQSQKWQNVNYKTLIDNAVKLWLIVCRQS
nr:MAG TPA: hypothetical protein [Caudoviricetes sp.]